MPGEVYKFEIKSRHNGYLVQKSDPYGFAAEMRPKTASVVWDVTKFEWHDQDWMKARAARQGLDAPISVYECHLGSWKRRPEEGDRFLTYRELADELVVYLQDTGFTHVELLPITAATAPPARPPPRISARASPPAATFRREVHQVLPVCGVPYPGAPYAGGSP